MIRLQMNSQMAKIGMQITQPTTTYDIKKPQLNLQSKNPRIKMETKNPKVYIDQTEAFADAGLKNIDRFTRDNVAEAKKLFLQGISRVVNQGDELSDIHNVNDDTTIASQAEYNASGQFQHEWGYTHIPKNGPKFTPIKGEVNISLERGEVKGQFDKGEVRTTLNRGNVDIYLRQRNRLEINISKGNQLDFSV